MALVSSGKKALAILRKYFWEAILFPEHAIDLHDFQEQIEQSCNGSHVWGSNMTPTWLHLVAAP